MKKRNIEKELEKRTFKEMWKYFKKVMKIVYSIDKKSVILVALFWGLSAFFAPIHTFLLAKVINDVLISEFSMVVLIMFIIMSLAWVLVGPLGDYYNIILRHKIKYQVDLMLQGKLDTLNIEDFQNKELYDNIERASNSNFEVPFVVTDFMTLLNKSIKMLAYLGMIVLWRWWIFAIIFTVNVVVFIKKYKLLRLSYVKYWDLTTEQRKANYYSFTMRKKESMIELKSLNAFKYILEKYRRIRYKVFKTGMDVSKKELKNEIEVRIMDEIMGLIFLVYLIIQALAKNILVGSLYAYNVSIKQISFLMKNVTEELAIINIRLLNAKELVDFLELDTNYIDGAMELKKINTIEFKHVWFKYQNNKKYALRDVNLVIKDNDKIALIGENGCGKTTLMKLLMKIHVSTKGKLLINGIDIKEYNTESLRNKITMLFQELTIYEDTVRENITLDKKKKGVDNVLASVPSKKFKEELKNMPKGIDTILGTWFGDGNEISKGQQQRLALARIFNRADSVLLLDEPNSALDPKAEKELFEYITNNKQDKICILTLHVFTNINQLDRIVMFEEGKIIAEGSHEELYKKSKEYKEYFDLQQISK